MNLRNSDTPKNETESRCTEQHISIIQLFCYMYHVRGKFKPDVIAVSIIGLDCPRPASIYI